jgi:predicted ATP-dependent serine protease
MLNENSDFPRLPCVYGNGSSALLSKTYHISISQETIISGQIGLTGKVEPDPDLLLSIHQKQGNFKTGF